MLADSLYDDYGHEGLFDELHALVKTYDRKGKHLLANVNYLYDLTSCYRYFFDGKITLPLSPVPAYPYDVMLAVRDLYAGKIDSSLAYFAKALKVRNRTNTDKNLFLNGLMSFYLVLAYKKADTEDSRKKVEQFLKKGATKDNRFLAPAAVLARTVGTAEEHENIVDDLLWTYYRVDDPLSKYLVQIVAGYFEAFGDVKGESVPYPERVPSYSIIRYELSPYLSLSKQEKESLRDIYGGAPLLASVHQKSRWEKVFADLSNMVAISKSAQGDGYKKERIGYFLNYNSTELEVRIQTRLKSGAWGAGRKAPMGDFFYGELPYMDSIDKRIAANVDSHFAGRIKVVEAIEFLVGTDKVFSFTNDPVEVVEEKPYVTFSYERGDLVPLCNVPMDKRGHFLPVSCVEVSRNKLSVLKLSDLQLKLLESIMSMRSIPVEAFDALRKLLPLVGQHIEIHSDLLDGGSTLQNIKGLSSVHLRIDPVDDFYTVSVFVRPLESGQKTFVPAEGEAVIYDNNSDGRFQVSRSMSEEKSNIDQLWDFVLSVLGLDVFEIANLALMPAEMLALVEWGGERIDRFILEWPEGKKVKVYSSSQASFGLGIQTNENWFDVEGEISLMDSSTLSVHDLLSLISAGGVVGNYVRLGDDSYLALTESLKKQMKRLESIAQLSRGKVRVSNYNIGPLADLIRSRQSVIKADDNFSLSLQRVEEASNLEPHIPDSLNATLRDYQYEGFRWMVRLAHWGAGACLADDMGLGKTLQAIAFMLYRSSRGPSLVVAPASVVMNWADELARFAPSMNVILLNHASDRAEALAGERANDVVLSTYGLLSQVGGLSTVEWNVVCLDEAHTIKNRQTKTSAAAMDLKAKARVILTGTPVQNYLGELWNLLQFLNPGLLGSYEAFSKKFISNSEADLATLKRVVQPFILRRTKAQVLDELPEKIEVVRNVELTDVEMLAYEGLRERARKELEGADKVSINALAEITRLRQAACSISLVDKNWSGANSKIESFGDLVSTIALGGNRVLVFSQFTSFLELAITELQSKGLDYFYLDGSTPIKQRAKMVDEFQSGVKPVFVISLKAGGLGLNLTNANYVIHLDPWWNPSIEQQATDRSYRIGQNDVVTVYHLISSHTIEEKILRLHKVKRDLADTFLEGTEVAHAISIEELRGLL